MLAAYCYSKRYDEVRALEVLEGEEAYVREGTSYLARRGALAETAKAHSTKLTWQINLLGSTLR